MLKGYLYLIPTFISENGEQTIAPATKAMLPSIKYYIVERVRTARRFLKAMDATIEIDGLTFVEMNKYSTINDIEPVLLRLLDGHDVGVMSEAGCPGVADPGHIAVQWCHEHSIGVRPLVGPSSILLALMASGLNGQNFAFNGYLPNKKPELIRVLKSLEQKLVEQEQTQIFMDAPYRNGFLIEHCLSTLSSHIKLCIASDILGEGAFIKTQTIKQWQGFNLESLHKVPALVLIGI